MLRFCFASPQGSEVHFEAESVQEALDDAVSRGAITLRQQLMIGVGGHWYTVTEALKVWHGDLPDTDDFGKPYGKHMVDGKTRLGPWANMTLESWEKEGLDMLGQGLGQLYELDDGRWRKVTG